MTRASRCIVLVLVGSCLVLSGRAHADTEPRVGAAVRVSAGFGALEEYSWAYPGVDLVGSLRFLSSGRGLVTLHLGYAPLDNRTFLSDGRMWRLGVSAGVRLGREAALSVAGTLALERALFHADPSVLAEHPGVDILASRSANVPAAGIEAAYRVLPTLALGLYARAGLGRIELFRENDQDPQAAGQAMRARLVLVGLFAELRVR